MSHFIPKFSVSSTKFSEADISAPNFSRLSSDDKILMGLTQNMIANMAGTEAIIRSSEEQYKAMVLQNKEANENARKQIESTLRLNQTLEDGFNGINNIISDLSYSLEIGIKGIIEQQLIANHKIDDLIRLIQIPEFEKERVFYFSEGIKFLKQALKVKKRYSDALENLLKAYELNKSDYITAHQIGLIYLYNEDYIDLVKAEQYLTSAADYGSGTGDLYVALTYQHLAYCQFLQAKFSDAANNARLGYEIDNSILELKIIELECEYALDNFNKVYDTIIELCEKDLSIIPLIRENVILNKGFNVIELLDKYENKLNEDIKNSYDKLVYFRPYIEVYYIHFYDGDFGRPGQEETIFSVLGYENKKSFKTPDDFYGYIKAYAEVTDFNQKVKSRNKLLKLIDVISDRLSDFDDDLDVAIEAYKNDLKVFNMKETVPTKVIEEPETKITKTSIILGVLALVILIPSTFYICDKLELNKGVVTLIIIGICGLISLIKK